MPKDIFKRDSSIGAPFSADDTEFIFVGGEAQTMIVQSMTVNYRQNVTRLWEIGSDKQYFVSGHQEGDANMARVVGPKPINSAFMQQYGDVCNVQENSITFVVKGDCSTEGGRIKVSGVVITQVSYSVRAQDMVVNEQVNMLVAHVADA
jgi:ketosteroid isomerase-like protein